MVFCAAESFDSTWKPADIAFPSNSELRCNQEEVKVNLKGLKNKPGSTRPADITPFLRKKTEFPNNVELIYALTTKKYVLSVNLVQRKTIEMLVQALKSGKFLGKDRVVREMQNRAKDDDIIATSSNMSLKDPVQMTRIETPCRSISCKHNECFDAAVFLALQEQAPTWTCPICNRPAAWETLVFDQFVQDILDNTSSDTEQVTIEPDGRWHLIKHEEPSYNKNPFVKHNDSDDDDDLVEIADLEAPQSTATIRTRPSQDLVRTPSLNGFSPPPPRPVSASLMQPLNTSQVQSQSQGKKRAREEVIDLTLDDDDDEPPVSRIKRPSLASQVSADTNRLLDLTSGPGPGSGPFRFNLPPPVPRTDSPSHYSDYYDFDQLRKFQ
ncbi:E3 SUMO-protein ligase pli1 [Lithohypha guttulata]|nr:E3 SUMO-protein ligase pli1 [Lithohypha guttulata]